MSSSTPLNAIKQRWWVVVVIAFAGLLIGAIPAPETVEEQATSYRARHTTLANSSAGGTGVSRNQVTLLATTGEVPARVADQLDFGGSPAELASRVDVVFDFETGALTFTATEDDPALAVQLADTFADVLTGYLAERQDETYQQRLAAMSQRLEGLEAELNQISAELAESEGDPILTAQRDAIARQYSVVFEQNRELNVNPGFLAFTTLQRAQAVPRVDRGLSTPTSRTTRAAMGLAAGLAIGLAAAVLLGRLDRKIRSRTQAEEVTEMRARVAIPKVRDSSRDGVVVVKGRHDAISDSYRTLRSVISFVQGGLEPVERARVTVVVSPGQGDGKTSIVANLSAAFAESGLRTVALNTDFRRPRLSDAIGCSSVPLPYTLDELVDVDPVSLLVRTDVPNLLVLDISSVDGTAGELIRETQRSLPFVTSISDALVVDTSPIGMTAEVLEMIPFADVIVVVVRLGHTSIASTQRTITALRDVSTAPIMLVLTGARSERSLYDEYTDERTLLRPIRRRQTVNDQHEDPAPVG